MENIAVTDNAQDELTYGLDIGIGSVGWAVLGSKRIVAVGVRAFDIAETADKGEALNLARRQARLLRRRLRRRAWRLIKLARLLQRRGLIAQAQAVRDSGATGESPWLLRRAGLDRQLTSLEWARAIYHLCKHRGFYWTSRAEEKAAEGDAKEAGRVKAGLAGTAALMSAKGYRTAAEMVLAEFGGKFDSYRNKRGEYTKALARALLGEELKLLFRRQRELGSPYADANLEAAILGSGDRRSGLFWAQKPALAGADLLKMLGRCKLERGEFRAPRASFTAERHVWLTRLNNLRISVGGVVRPLTRDERALALPLPYQKARGLSYRDLRETLVKAGLLPDSARYAGLSYPSAAQIEAGKAKDPEAASLVKLAAWHEIRLAMKRAGLESEWQGIATQALEGGPELLDQIARVLSVFKDDLEVEPALAALKLPGGAATVEALLDLRFSQFHALSLKALRKIVPHMEAGLRYDEACPAAGYHHSQIVKPGERAALFLPPLYVGRDMDGRMVLNPDLDAPRNPVVLRALNQARKVVNALIRTYGPPHEVHIEMARDLSRPLDERRDIEKEQAKYRERNEADRAQFKELFGTDPTGLEFEKFRLYREQQAKCAYSLEPLEPHRLLEAGYVEIDHALPYSRSFDDSKINKVLVLSRENRDKGNATPYEYLGGAEDSERWQRFVAFVESNKSYRQAKRSRLLRKNFGEAEAREFKERNLNDTRYICRFFKNYVEQNLRLADGSGARRCVVLSGQLTAFLRARWALTKRREESDRHHAIDALVVAACSHAMVNRLSDYARRRELEKVRAGFVDMETGEIANPQAYQQLARHFPSPWPYFRDEVKARVFATDPAELRATAEALGTYPPDALASLQPLFVSRAPRRRSGGAVHKETVYRQDDTARAEGSATEKVPLTSLTLKDLDRLVDPHRNQALYDAIRARLEAAGGKGDKAFGADKPLHKPDRSGAQTGPLVRTVRLKIDKITGVPVRGGVARNDTMLRIDVFAKGGRYFVVPVYAHHRVSGLPNRAVVAFKDEAAWTLIDDSYAWCFSAYPNDLLKITLKQGFVIGYYAGLDRSGGTVALWAPDRAASVGVAGLVRGIGVKTAVSFEKLAVDVLGKVHHAQAEPRRELA